MKGIIVNYRGGVNTQYTNQMIVQLEGISKKEEAVKHMGARVVWKTPSGKEIVGKISKPHGGKGVVVVRFNKGLPGQAVGTAVEVTPKK